MIRAVIFDCFGVLYADESHRFYEEQVRDPEVRRQLFDFNKQSDYGLISKDEWIDNVTETLGIERDFVEKNLQRIHRLNQPLLDYAESLRSHYKLGMLSNVGVGAMDEFFSPEERERLFDGVVLSGEVGLIKPHPEIFRVMAERLDCSPSECIMIDDIKENCAGADAAGMRAIHYESNSQTIDELEALLRSEDA